MRRRYSVWLALCWLLVIAPVSPQPLYAADSPPLFSISAFGNDQQNLSSLGARTVRVFVNWPEIQPTAATIKYNWAAFDYYITLYQNQNLTPIVVIAGVPAWACVIPPLPRDTSGMSCPPEEKAYLAFLEQLVVSFRGKVRFWEIGNEPNTYSRTWTPAYYARHLAVSYQTIKRLQPKSVVVMGGLAQDLSAGRFFDQEHKEADLNGQYTPALVYAKKVMDLLNSTEFLRASRAYDAVAIHPFRTMTSPTGTVEIVTADGTPDNVTFKQQLQAMQLVFYENDPQKLAPDVWITAIGWSAIDDKDDINSESGTVSLSKQKLYLSDVYRMAMNDSTMGFVKVINWIIDYDADDKREANQTDAQKENPKLRLNLMGLRFMNGELKPAGEAYWQLSQEWLQKQQAPPAQQ